MTHSTPGWHLLALSISLLLHLLIVINWSDSSITRAAIDEQKAEPLFVQLNFPQPIPEIIPEVVQPTKPVVEKVVKTPPKPKPKDKPKPKHKPKPKEQIAKATPKPVEKIAPDPKPLKTMQAKQTPTPPRAHPKADIQERYLAKLLARIEEKKRYPSLARRKNIEGNVQVSFKLACDGKVTDLDIIGEHRLLRKAAGKAIKAAHPLPEIPPQISCPLPINYAMAYTLDH